MNKLFKISILSSMFATAFILAANAMCPVCTAIVGGAAIGMRSLGVAEALIGVWVGGLAPSIMFWMWSVMKKKNLSGTAALLFLFPPAFASGLLFAIWTVFNLMGYGQETLFGMSAYLAGIMLGAPMFIAAAIWHLRIKRANGGKSWFPGQKVVWPVGALLIATAIMWTLLQVGDTTYRPCPFGKVLVDKPCPALEFNF